MQILQLTPNHTDRVNSLVDFLQAGDENDTSDLSPGSLMKMLTDDRSYVFVAIVDDRVAGYVSAYRFPSLYGHTFMAYLYDIEVAAHHRRKGLGKGLMQAVKTQLQKDGVSEMWLGTATDNEEGQALFTATGGERSGETFNDFTFYL